MKLETAEYKISLNHEELRDIAYCIKHDLLQSIDDHYNKLQQNQDGELVFEDHCKQKVRILKYLSNISGESIFDDFEYMKNKAFTDKRKERESIKP